MPVSVKVDGPAAPYFAKGKEFYYTRRGQMDIACAQCHEQNAGNSIGVENLSQGRSNGYPAYRLKWQSFGSLHRRFEGCNQEVRTQPYPRGSDERSEEHTSELQSLMRISYAVFCLTKNNNIQ